MHVVWPPPIDADAPAQSLEALVEALRDQINSLNSQLELQQRHDMALRVHMQTMDQEMRLAARLQRDFLPKATPQVGPVHFHTIYCPASFVSGDMYDVMRLDERHIGVYLADAIGHGMPAALLAMFLKRALQVKEISGGDYRLLPPSETMQRLNRALIEQSLDHCTFATAIYGRIDTQTLRLQVARGGHPAALLLRPGEPARAICPDGSLLGVFDEDEYSEQSVQLRRADRVIFYTDGIEVIFSDGQAPDPRRWIAEMESRRDWPSDRLLEYFRLCAEDQSEPESKKDDLSMVMLEIEG